MLSRSRSLRSAGIAVAALALLASGCTGDGSGDGDEQGNGADATVSATPRENGVSPTDLPTVPQLKQAKGVASDVEQDGECTTDAGKQEVAGTLTNSGGRPRDFVITVSWINDTSDVLGRGVAVVKGVPPKESRDWKASARVVEGATQCTLNAQAGKVGG
ncbi:FxLYD domain-containing protein [Nocardioides panacisoli]|uniref:FxLYD domain-containing protein n=1 Tax=Nocardioides panacisoli TaxID=627624 RepID=UPI001C62D3CD|nr:FxLYD domain-containing protein [Nocardioides panacisoli]QYJ02919.1 FxLYD domain-containing protein [Nocardioides panacisoli]